GTGRGGRITKGDALAAAGVISSAPTPAQAPAPTPAPAKQSAQAAAGAPVQHSLPGPSARPEGVAPGTFTDAKPSSMRKVIAARLTESKAKVPHFYVQGDCMIDSVTELRAQLASAGVKVSLNDIVIKAAALALRAVPEANAAFVPGEGRDADKKGLAAINAEVRDLATRGRAGKLAPEEYQGGTFTISNLGMFGITDFTAVINPPQACILAVGTGRQEAVLKVDAATGGDVLSAEPAPAEVAEEDVTFITNMAVQLSGDRRVVDESVAGQFIATFKHYMLNPLLLMA
ncbi:Pdhx, partial [Symbiodinium sp. KB8]